MGDKHGFVRTFLDYPKESHFVYVGSYRNTEEIILLKTYRGDWAWRFAWDDDRARNWLKASSYDEASRLAKCQAENELQLQDSYNYGDECGYDRYYDDIDW